MEQDHLSESSNSELIAYKWKALVTVSLSIIMMTMDFSVTSISFPILNRVFEAEVTTVVWVTLVYSLISTSLLLILGRIGDLFGRKKVFSTGLAVFTLGLLACSLSRSIGQLILFRAFQAIGSAMILSCGTAIVTEAFPDEERGKGLGILGISVSFGLVTGPMIGGVLLRWLDWRSIYYIRSPVGFMALLIALTVLKKDMVKIGKINLDLMGALTSSAGLACLVFSISQISRLGFGSSLIQLLISVSILCLIAFIFIEQRATAPIVDFSLFKNRAFSFSICGLFLIFVSYPAYFLIMPFYLIQGLGMTASTAGLLMAVPYTVGIILSPISGSLSDRFGPFWFVFLGAVSIIASFLLMRGFDLRTQIMTLIPACLLFGACDGLFQAPNNSTIMGNTPKDRYGMASAIMALLRQMGMSLGMALISAVYSARIDVHQEELSRQGLENTLISRLSIPLAFHDVLIVSLIIASIVLLISFPLKRYSPLRRNR